VEPTRSQNTIVTTFRAPAGPDAAPSAVPQTEQNRARSGVSWPQFGQVGTPRV
jgi:hypothetical protein